MDVIIAKIRDKSRACGRGGVPAATGGGGLGGFGGTGGFGGAGGPGGGPTDAAQIGAWVQVARL